jgi:hypothetical protein
MPPQVMEHRLQRRGVLGMEIGIEATTANECVNGKQRGLECMFANGIAVNSLHKPFEGAAFMDAVPASQPKPSLSMKHCSAIASVIPLVTKCEASIARCGGDDAVEAR